MIRVWLIRAMFIAKKQCNELRGRARLHGDLTWPDVYDQHGVGITASPHR